jgi:catechol 2,3-dioxygenase-like lactoylglutathione lyase family enzyme
MILAFAHPALVVPDLERAREFYEEMFGFRVIGREGWNEGSLSGLRTGVPGSSCRGYYLAGHNCFLELFQFDKPQSSAPEPGALLAHEPGIRHLAFYVDDCRKELQRLLDLGGQRLGEFPSVGGPFGAIYCRDPFGNIIELCEVPSPDEEPSALPGVSCSDTYSGRG